MCITKLTLVGGVLTFLVLVVAGQAEDGPYLGLDQQSPDIVQSATPAPSSHAVVRLPLVHGGFERVPLGDTPIGEYPDTEKAKRCLSGQKGAEPCGLSTAPSRQGNPAVAATTSSPRLRTGKKHGPWADCYPSGKRRAEGQYDHGLPTGKFTWWYENGQKQIEGTFVAGKRQGTWVSWHRNGAKASESLYQEGQVLGERVQWDMASKPIGFQSDGTVRDRTATAGSSTHSYR